MDTEVIESRYPHTSFSGNIFFSGNTFAFISCGLLPLVKLQIIHEDDDPHSILWDGPQINSIPPEMLVWWEDWPFFRVLTAKCQDVNTIGYDIPIADGILFSQLVEKWYMERGATSSLSEITSCPSYLKIIRMGQRALPLLLDQIRREGDDPDHWFAALEAITGEDPVPEDALWRHSENGGSLACLGGGEGCLAHGRPMNFRNSTP